MPHRLDRLPATQPWQVTARRAGEQPLLRSQLDQAAHAAALAAVITQFWPELVATCRRPGPPRLPALTSAHAA